MTRPAAAWVEREFGDRIRLLNPNDPRGPTILWSKQDIYEEAPPEVDGGVVLRAFIGTYTCHTYVSDFLAMASEVIEDDTFPDDEAVHAELRKRGLEPPPA